jgi:histidine triad (HIT) family protein
MTQTSAENCIFCQIIKRQTPTEIIYQDDLVTAFFDIQPITPVHILIVPNQHINSVDDASPEHEQALGRLFSVAQTTARQNSIHESGYRLVVNTGPQAGQTVYHLHMHLIGGRQMPFHSQ